MPLLYFAVTFLTALGAAGFTVLAFGQHIAVAFWIIPVALIMALLARIWAR